MNSDNWIFEEKDSFGTVMILKLSKNMGIVPECIDKIIVTVRYKKKKVNE